MIQLDIDRRCRLLSTCGCAWLLAALTSTSAQPQQEAAGIPRIVPEEVISWWPFDAPAGDGILDAAGDMVDRLYGAAEYVPGIRENAMRLDGLRTCVRRERYVPSSPGDSFTVEFWVALACYPWSWAPVVDCSDQEIRGFCLEIGPEGHVELGIAAGSSWHEARTERRIPLRRWTHVAAVFEPHRGISVYIDGEEAAHARVEGNFVPARHGPLTIGRNNVPRTWNELQLTTEDAWFFLDGLLDETRISRRAKTEADFCSELAAAGSPPAPALSDRGRFPTGPVGSGGFGAFYARLDYYPEWDDLWRVSDVPDLFVRFDRSPVQLVFWRGTSFVPCWVTENDIWYTNEWLETWGSDVVSCAEPIMDRHCRYSHVRLIESTDARAVIHWRYALSDAHYRIAAVGDDGRGEWCDEFHVIYPDQVGVRKMQLHYSRPERKHDWVEQIVVLPPGRHPEEVIERSAVSLVNMDGEVQEYSWHGDLGLEMTEPERANISYVHLKSRYRPFFVLPDDPVETVEGSWDSPFFRSYASKMATGYSPDPPPSVCGWWNHWPVAQVPGDGRWVITPDRPSHFNLTTFVQWKDHSCTARTRTRIMLQGVTDGEPDELLPLARSWLHPPELKITSGAFEGGGYDPSERAYLVERTDPDDADPCAFAVDASVDSPLLNPAIVIGKWGSQSAILSIDGRPVEPGGDFRQGIRRRATGEDLIIWLRLDVREPVTITLASAASGSTR